MKKVSVSHKAYSSHFQLLDLRAIYSLLAAPRRNMGPKATIKSHCQKLKSKNAVFIDCLPYIKTSTSFGQFFDTFLGDTLTFYHPLFFLQDTSLCKTLKDC